MKTDIKVLLGFILFWFLLIIGSQTMFSGYHFMDDSLILTINHDIQENGLWQAMNHYVMNDFNIRFRPLWCAMHVCKIYFLGDNMLLYSIYKGLYTALTCFILYKVAKRLHWNNNLSIGFATSVLIGQQASISWMSAPAESVGLFFFALTLLYMSYAVQEEKNKIRNYILFFLWAIATSLCKESFIVLMPGVFLWYAYLYQLKHQSNFWICIRKNIIVGFILALITCTDLFLLFKLVGNNFGYAGIETKFSLLPYVKTGLFILIFSGTGITFLILAMIYIFKNKIQIQSWLFPILICLSITLPQIILYASSGIAERYMIPGVLGFSFILFWFIHMTQNSKSQFQIKKTIYIILFTLGLLITVLGFILTINESLRKLLAEFIMSFRGKVIDSMTSQYVMETAINSFRILGIAIALFGLLFIVSIGFAIKKKITALTFNQLCSILTVICLMGNLLVTFSMARKFAKRGLDTNNFLEAIDTHSNNQNPILIVGDPWVDYEAAGIGITQFLKLKKNKTNLIALPIYNNEANKPKDLDHYLPYYNNQSINQIKDFDQIQTIAVFPGLNDKFIQSQPWFKSQLFQKNDINGYIVYYKISNQNN